MPKLLDEFPPISTEAWEDAIRADLKGADYEKTLVWQAEDGIAVKPYYRAEDAAALEAGPLRSTPGWIICEPGSEPTIDVDAATFEELGATTVQELGYALAGGIAHLETGKSHDITFQFAIGSNYFFQIAKLRAFRLLWSQVLDAFDIKDAKTTLHCRTSKWNKSIYDAHVNILRATTEALSAVLGGADSLSVEPFDATYKTPDPASERLARNTQLILKHEAYLDQVADPAAGSYYLEALTESLACEAWTLMRSIQTLGGFYKAHSIIHAGLAESRAAKKAAVAERRRAFVGVNHYPNLQEKALPKLEKDAASDVDRGPKPFEQIRLATERSGRAPRLLLAEIGDPKMSKGRSRAAADFFGAAGFEIEQERFETIQEIAAVRAGVVVVCSSDAECATLVPDLREKLNGSTVVIAADSALFRGDAVAKLKHFQHKLGIVS